jgi:hypothetical protein
MVAIFLVVSHLAEAGYYEVISCHKHLVTAIEAANNYIQTDVEQLRKDNKNSDTDEFLSRSCLRVCYCDLIVEIITRELKD